RCHVAPVVGEDGKPRPDVARIQCELPVGTAGSHSLAAALLTAGVEGVARDRIWFVYRVSPAEQVPIGQFVIAVVYVDSLERYEQARAANTDPAYVFTTAPDVMPVEEFLMHKSHRQAKAPL